VYCLVQPELLKHVVPLGVVSGSPTVPDKADGIELLDLFCVHRVALKALLADPGVKSWVFGVVLMARDQTMAVLLLESLQLVELG
jgi:hypothetical protein